MNWERYHVELALVGLGILSLIYTVFPHEVAGGRTHPRYCFLLPILEQLNQGNYLQSAPGESLMTRWVDIGYSYLVTLLAWLGNEVFSLGLVMDHESYAMVQFLVLAFGALVFSSRVVPIGIWLVFMGGLVLGFMDRLIDWHWDGFWAPAVAMLVTGGWLFTLARGQNQPMTWGSAFTLGVGFLVSWLGMIRHDARLISLMAVALFLFLVLLRHMVERSRTMAGATELGAGRRVAWHVVLFFLATQSMNWLFWGHLQLHQTITGINHQVGVGEHGSWHNLYIGLGYRDENNPYGIQWNDRIGSNHANRELALPSFNSLDYLHSLRTQFFQVIRDDPLSFMENIREKFLLLLAVRHEFGKISWKISFSSYVPLACYLLALGYAFRRMTRYGEHHPWMVLVALLLPTLAVPLLVMPFHQYSRAALLAMLTAPLWLAGEAVVRLVGSGAAAAPRGMGEPGHWPTVAWFAGGGIGLVALALLGLIIDSALMHRAVFAEGTLGEFFHRWEESRVTLRSRITRDLPPPLREGLVREMKQRFPLFVANAEGMGEEMTAPSCLVIAALDFKRWRTVSHEACQQEIALWRQQTPPPREEARVIWQADDPLFTIGNVVTVKGSTAIFGKAGASMPAPEFYLRSYMTQDKVIGYYTSPHIRVERQGFDEWTVRPGRVEAGDLLILVFDRNAFLSSADLAKVEVGVRLEKREVALFHYRGSEMTTFARLHHAVLPQP